MKIGLKAFIIALFLTGGAVVGASQERQLTWEDLIPAHIRATDPLAHLTQDQLDLVYWVIRTLEMLPERGPETENLYQELDKAKPELKKEGIDLDKIMADREINRKAIVEELNGQSVRIPGYLLPLELSGTHVTEFLLVPYVGACIHAPPPPPNQIVYVQTAPKQGYKSEQLFDPVWVTGILKAQSLEKDLYLIDGTAGIEIGYSLQARRIEPYQE